MSTIHFATHCALDACQLSLGCAIFINLSDQLVDSQVRRLQVIVYPWMTLRILQTDAHQQSGKLTQFYHAGMWQGRLPRCKQTCHLHRQLQVQPPGKWKQPEQMTERSSR